MRIEFGIICILIACVVVQAQQVDTLKFGEYYIDNHKANIPLLSVIDLKTSKPIGYLSLNQWYEVKLTSGLFDKYKAEASIESGNGVIEETKDKNQYRIRATSGSSKVLKLKVIHQMKGDTIVYVIREWATAEKLKYIEKIERVGVWKQAIWLGIKE